MPKAVPKELKKIRGTYRPDRDKTKGRAAPDRPGRMWPAPAFLNDPGQRVWTRLGRALLEVGLLTEADRDGFAMLCADLGRWVEIQTALKGAPLLTDGRTNPLLAESRLLGEAIRKRANEFGLSPSSRTNVFALATAEDEPDDLATLLFRRINGEETDRG